MLKAKVFVTLKPSVLDPQGKVVMHSLNNLGYDSVKDVRVSKYIELNFDSEDENKVKKELEEICDKVLANPNTETYHYTVEKIEK